jgi:cytochrome c551/c552
MSCNLREEDGPPFRIAQKYRGKAGAEEKVTIHITTQPKVKMGGVSKHRK